MKVIFTSETKEDFRKHNDYVRKQKKSDGHKYLYNYQLIIERRGLPKRTKKEDNLSIIFSAVRRGLEPLTPCVTGTYSNQLN